MNRFDPWMAAGLAAASIVALIGVWKHEAPSGNLDDARAMMARQQFAQAAEAYERLAGEHPGNATITFELGNSLLEQWRREPSDLLASQASDAYISTVGILGFHAESLEGFAEILVATDEIDLAIETLTQVVDVKPDRVETHRALATLLERKADDVLAAKHWAVLLRDPSTEAEGRQALERLRVQVLGDELTLP